MGKSSGNWPSCLVIKLGTQVVIREDCQLEVGRLSDLVSEMVQLIRAGRSLLVVSSGAVGLGRAALRLTHGAGLDLIEKQACAAVGQNLLMEFYRSAFGNHGISTAQVLLTADDFSSRKRFLNLRSTLRKLLELGVVPVINENDTVSSAELMEDQQSKSFGDNDRLSALVAGKLGADLLILLTTVDGVFTDDPEKDPSARPIGLIDDFSVLTDVRTRGTSRRGRGGMAAKLAAARIASISGVETWVASGIRSRVLEKLLSLSPDFPFTRVLPSGKLSGKKQWIGVSSGFRGVITINAGARSALLHKKASLLPGGVVGVDGKFEAREIVSIQDETRAEIGRGMVNYSARELGTLMGARSSEIALKLGPKSDRSEFPAEVIHRNDLVLFSWDDGFRKEPEA